MKPATSLIQVRGHLRPMLHLCIQLLTIHPSLRITMLLSPASAPRCRTEVASSAFDHLRRSDTEAAGPDHLAVLDRLQMLNVSHAKESNILGTQLMENEMVDALPDYVATLFGAEGRELNEQENKFKGRKPSMMMYDVSAPPMTSSR